MEVWQPTMEANMSVRVLHHKIHDVGEYPAGMQCDNASVAFLCQVAPGIFHIKATNPTACKQIIAGGIHGDEKAGVHILDQLIRGIRIGTITVRRDVLLVYGNLEAMAAQDGVGVRCVEMDYGVTANLNRCFGAGVFANPGCYAETRANVIMDAVGSFVELGEPVDVIDVHQSFSVPSLQAVRGDVLDRSEYTYVMLYQNSTYDPLAWMRESYSDIIAGAVLNDMTVRHHTFAGHMAREYGARAATFEQGTIGFIDHDTFTPQLCQNLVRKIQGETVLVEPESFDVWQTGGMLVKETESFHFVSADGTPSVQSPQDFAPITPGVVARDGDVVHMLSENERLLFANPHVPIGDRVAQLVTQLHSYSEPLLC